MLIKYFLIILIVFIILRVTNQFRRGGLNVREYFFWLILWCGGVVVILRPETATFLANLVGVGRGADFMVYISVVLLFYLVFRVIARQERMEREITKLAREIAIKHANKPTQQAKDNS